MKLIEDCRDGIINLGDYARNVYLPNMLISFLKKNPNFLKEYEEMFGLEEIQDIIDKIGYNAKEPPPDQRSDMKHTNHTSKKENST